MWKIGEMNQIFLGTLSAIVIPLSACIRSSYRNLHDELTGDTGDTFGWLSPDFDGWWFGTCFIFPYCGCYIPYMTCPTGWWFGTFFFPTIYGNNHPN